MKLKKRCWKVCAEVGKFELKLESTDEVDFTEKESRKLERSIKLGQLN